MSNKNIAFATFFLRQVLLRMALTLAFFMLCRVIFYTFNRAILPTPTLADFLWGIRFDLSAAAYVNVLLWLTYLVPFDFRSKKNYQIFQKGLFLLTNFAAYSSELIDVVFFKFQNRRTLLTDFGLFKNTINLWPSYLAEYWFLVLGAVAFWVILAFLYDKTTLKPAPDAFPKVSNDRSKMINFDQFRPFLIQMPISILSLGLWLLAARGGTQLRPITPLSTTDIASDMRLMPLVSNTTLNFIFSTQQKFINEKNYITDAEAKAIYPIFDQFEPRDSFRKLNVVILTLESFGKEYSRYFNANKIDYQGFTPFLDSLAQVSFQAKQSFANGLRSAQGIVAVTSGLPSLMEDPFVFSPYQSNRIDGLAAHLKGEGYETAFFHGSNPGSMEFDKFARLTGFNHFYDRYGYGNQADYDGNWGIWDAPMLQFMAQKLTQTPEPFYGFFFSLTSHHPYNVPVDFEKKYPNVDALHRSVLYADNALRQFFETARQQSWFDRTLFVICADHVGAGSFVPEYQTKVGRYNIPILFYKSNEIKAETRPDVVQQQDIMPSILDFLNYKNPFLSFGRSIFEKNKSVGTKSDSMKINDLSLNSKQKSTNFKHTPLQTSNFKLQTPRYSFHFEEGLYQIHDARFALFFDGDRTTGLYDYTSDVFLKNNLKDSLPNDAARLENVLKAVIQQYNKAMQGNHLTPN
jgi:phosphoglycerol transferase MdoB-like AlkP superfamily enzyme